MAIEETLCPICNKKMVSRKGKYGSFWGCKSYPKCNGTRDNMGRSRDERERENQKEKDEETDRHNGPNRFPFRRS